MKLLTLYFLTSLLYYSASHCMNFRSFVEIFKQPTQKVLVKKGLTADSKKIAELSPQAMKEIPGLKTILVQHDIFKDQKIQSCIIDYLIPWIHLRWLCLESYVPPNEIGDKVKYKGARAFYLPIVRMSFSEDGTRLTTVMSIDTETHSEQCTEWNVHTAECIWCNCRAYWDVEIEGATPPACVETICQDGSLKAQVVHEFYPNDAQFPAPGNGAYKPQYQVSIQLLARQWEKDALARVFLSILKDKQH